MGVRRLALSFSRHRGYGQSAVPCCLLRPYPRFSHRGSLVQMAPNPKAPKGRQVEHRSDHRSRRSDVPLLFHCELRSPGFQEFRGVQSPAPSPRVDLSTTRRWLGRLRRGGNRWRCWGIASVEKGAQALKSCQRDEAGPPNSQVTNLILQ